MMTDYNRVFFDTAPFIFFLERNPNYYNTVKSFVSTVCDNDVDTVTSAITVEEYCVYPYRDNNTELLRQFDDFIRDMEMEVVSVDETVARKAAQIKAEYRFFKSMDAIQLASACLTGCDLFLTNDRQLKQFKEIKVITVDEL